ncbi:MAG: ABC transporter ATP-binding protein [Lentisphaerae bacterium]|nr:ABC transporter ATP-binding protein [Lentisphaerota bacterium]
MPDNRQPTTARRASSYRRLLRFARPYAGRLVLGGICGALFAGSSVGFLPVLRTNFAAIFDYERADLARALLGAALLPLLALVRGAGEYLSAYLIQWVGNRVVMDLRVEAYTHLQNLSVAYFDQNKTGEMISRTVNDTSLLEHAVSTVLTDLVRQPLLIAGGAAYLLALNWRLTLAGLVLFPLSVLPVVVFGKKVRAWARQGQERLADIVSIMQESIAGVRIVKAFNMEAEELRRFAAQCRSFFGRVMRVVRAKAIVEPLVVLMASLGIVCAMAYAGLTRMPFEDFVTFGLGLVLLFDPAKRLGRLHLSIQQSSAAADRIFEVLDADIAVRDRPGAAALAGPVREIRFENVGFSYHAEPVLRGINAEIRHNDRVALVGSSGAGKTTLVNLLPRFFDVTEGRIVINGCDIRDASLASLRALFGLVTQETFLFNDSVANNIAYGAREAGRARIEEAARRAHAHEFIMAMPAGYDTVIGERGVRLSGGQRQRLAIARAVMRDPPVLILDEATSALDTESERQVQAALNELMEGRTVFAIAHRLSTLAHCNRVLVLDAGRVAEEGSHEELYARDGIYRRLYDLQFEGMIPDAAARNGDRRSEEGRR